MLHEISLDGTAILYERITRLIRSHREDGGLQSAQRQCQIIGRRYGNEQTKVQSALLLDIVVGEGTAILKLLPGENETLLIRWNAFLILNLRFHIIDCVRRLNLERDRLAGESVDEDLHASAETKDYMTCG